MIFGFMLATLCCGVLADSSNSSDVVWVEATNAEGVSTMVRDDRQPSLYTGDFGDCMGNSLIAVTRFDAAYYQDNMTVLFHLEGDTQLASDGVMMYIQVYAYGENRFSLAFNPCYANIFR